MVKSTEKLLQMIGCHNKYQIYISILYILIGSVVDFTSVLMPLMTSFPIVTFTDDNGKRHKELMKYEFCKYNDIQIVESESMNNWSVEFELYCSKIKTSILSSSFYIGSILINLYFLFLSKYSKESSLKALGLFFVVSHIIILFPNYYGILFFNIILGFNQSLMYIIRVSVITEITCSEYRSYFVNCQFTSGVIGSLFISFFLLFDNVGWKIRYYSCAGAMLLLTGLSFIFVKTNPTYLVVNRFYDKAKESLQYIRKVNKSKFCGGQMSSSIEKKEREEEMSVIESYINSFKSADDDDKKSEEPKSEETEEINKESFIVSEDKLVLDQSKSSASNINEPEKQFLVNKDEQKLSFRLKLLMMMIIHNLNFFIVFYESKDYANDSHLNIVNTSSSIISASLLVLLGYIMNLKFLGRKGTSIIIIVLCVLPRIACLFYDDFFNIYFYYTCRVLITLVHTSVNTLILENLSHNARIKYYGTMYFISKVFVYFVPYIYEFLTNTWYNIYLITVTSCEIVLLLFIRETNGEILSDY